MPSRSENLFLRRTLALFGVIIFLAAFFIVYNTYIVDRSILNLRAALNEVSSAQSLKDIQKIKDLLRVPLLRELSKNTAVSEALLSLETAESISSNASDIEQLEDIKVFLNNALKLEEKQRGAFLSFLDRINSAFFKAEVAVPSEKLKARAEALSIRANALRDSRLKQETFFQLGNIYIQLSDLSLAEEAFKQAINIDADKKVSLKAAFNLAWGYKTFGHYDKALNLFEELSRQAVDKETAVISKYAIADTFYKKGDYQAARDRYTELAKENPQFYEFSLSRAGYISFTDLKDFEGAEKAFSELQEKGSEARTKELLARDFRRKAYQPIKEKNFQQAIEGFKKAIEISPSDSRSYSGLSLCYYWMEEKAESLYYAKKALETAGSDEVTLTNVLFVYINYEELDEAIRVGEEFLAKRTQAIRRPEFYYNLAYAYLFKAKYNEASTYFDRAIRLNREFTFAHNNLGCVFWSTKNYSEAIKKFKDAIARNPAYADAYYNLGVVYHHLNLLEEATSAFTRVLDIDPKHSRAENYLLRIKEIQKRKFSK